MSELVLQGVAAELGKPFCHGDKILILPPGCFDKSMRSGHDVKSLLDHDENHCLGSWKDRLLIHAGEKQLGVQIPSA